jgi:DDE_Tnp_1-associated
MQTAHSAPTTMPSLLVALQAVPDRRKRRGRRYSQAAMLTFAVCAMLCGARSLYAIAQWGREQAAADIRAALGISRASTPSIATVFRLFRDLDVSAFEQALAGWVTAQGVPAGDAIALDGKSIRGLHGEAVPGVHLVAAYAQQSGQVLGQKGAANATPK